MTKQEHQSHLVTSPLTAGSARVEIHSTSRPNLSDKNGLAAGRKNRLTAVFAFVDL